MFGIGPTEMIVILVIALLVIGPKRLPELARTLGKAMAELKSATADVTEELENARIMMESEARQTGKTAARPAAAEDNLPRGKAPIQGSAGNTQSGSDNDDEGRGPDAGDTGRKGTGPAGTEHEQTDASDAPKSPSGPARRAMAQRRIDHAQEQKRKHEARGAGTTGQATATGQVGAASQAGNPDKHHQAKATGDDDNT